MRSDGHMGSMSVSINAKGGGFLDSWFSLMSILANPRRSLEASLEEY
jgi:hypothetical protein